MLVADGLDGAILQKHRAAGITASVVRASAGATEHASIASVAMTSVLPRPPSPVRRAVMA